MIQESNKSENSEQQEKQIELQDNTNWAKRFQKADLSDSYAKYRIRYPKAFIQLLIKNHVKNEENKIAMDLATGTGFLADLLSQSFKQVVGCDVSQSQITVAQKLFPQPNINFQVANLYEVDKLLNSTVLPKKPALITIAQAIHWFEPEKIYPYLSSKLMIPPTPALTCKDEMPAEHQNEEEKPDPSVLMVLAYSTSLKLSYGDNWFNLVSTPVKGYEIFNGEPDYQFQGNDEEKKVCEEADLEFQTFWTKIYKHMNAAVPQGHKFIDNYYQDLEFPASSHIQDKKRYLWFAIERKRATDIIDMVQTYPSYVNYLKANGIEEGTLDDPLVPLKEKLFKMGYEKKFDLICPFFCVVGQRKEEEVQ